MIGIEPLDFQDDCVQWLTEVSNNPHSKQIITVKSPTGSGKTIILLSFIEKFLEDNPKTAFIWLCPGKGNLEEQSKQKMDKFLPGYEAYTLHDALHNGFNDGSTTFINWELVTKKGNKAITDSEKKNLFDIIKTATLNGTNFVVIIDEEHSNDTKKANDIINAFSAKHIIRVSATTIKNRHSEFYEIHEADVIAKELITKAVWINLDIDGEYADALTEYSHLINKADEKRKEMAQEYANLKSNIRPLVIIQMPNKSNDLLKDVEKHLESLGYTYQNKMVAKWLDNSKEMIDGIEEPDADPVFMIMKQAIATGWDCPRAKILVKLREGMGDTFTTQTIGRIRRMPEHKHYDNDVLNYSYIYTFDDKFKNGLINDLDKAYEPERFILKDKCKAFYLESEKRTDFVDKIDEKILIERINQFFKTKYHLDTDIKNNQTKLEIHGYKFYGIQRESIYYQGKVVQTDHALEDISMQKSRRDVNTHTDGRDKMHAINVIATASGLYDAVVNRMFTKMFLRSRRGGRNPYRLLSFNNNEYYAFIINNVDTLRHDFYEASSQAVIQQTIKDVKKRSFNIPPKEIYPVDKQAKDVVIFNSNSYKDYNDATFIKRSTSERLFEKWCEEHSDIVNWYYKNGDNGSEYFSVVYSTGMEKQREFYPDYIIKLVDDNVWLIETKGGEQADGTSKQYDKQIKNKFIAFKNYCSNHNVKWGFVRDKMEKLYINNTEYNDDLSDDSWILLDKAIRIIKDDE